MWMVLAPMMLAGLFLGFELPFLLPLLFAFGMVRIISRQRRQPANQSWARPAGDGVDRTPEYEPRRAVRPGRTDESRIFRLARSQGGAVTVSDVVVETGLDVNAAEAMLDRLVDGLRVTMDVEDDGSVVYSFPEIRRRIDRD